MNAFPPPIQTWAFNPVFLIGNALLWTAVAHQTPLLLPYAKSRSILRRSVKGVIFFTVAVAVLAIQVNEGRNYEAADSFPSWLGGVWALTIILSLALHILSAIGRPDYGVVVVIIVGLVSLLRPAVVSRPAAPRSASYNNLKHIGIGLRNLAAASKRPRDDGLSMSWRVRLLPYVDQSPLWDGYRVDLPWNHPANAAPATTILHVYQTELRPLKRDAEGRAFTSYALVVGPGTAFPDGKAVLEIPGRTIIAGETEGLNIPWAEPRDADVSRLSIGINLPGRAAGSSDGLFSSYWKSGGVNVLRADGSVNFISKDIDPDVLRAQLSPSGNAANLSR